MIIGGQRRRSPLRDSRAGVMVAPIRRGPFQRQRNCGYDQSPAPIGVVNAQRISGQKPRSHQGRAMVPMDWPCSEAIRSPVTTTAVALSAFAGGNLGHAQLWRRGRTILCRSWPRLLPRLTAQAGGAAAQQARQCANARNISTGLAGGKPGLSDSCAITSRGFDTKSSI